MNFAKEENVILFFTDRYWILDSEGELKLKQFKINKKNSAQI